MLHLVEMAEQHFGKGIAIGKAKKARKALKLRTFGRQSLRLFVVHHLQAVFDHPQEAIGFLHSIARCLVDPFVLAQLVERVECVAIAQSRIAAAGDQLLGLHEEFDFADAAAAKLDIVAFDRDVAMARDRR